MITREEMLQFGKRLRWIRSSCGLRQDILADVMGVDHSTLSYYESGALFPSMGKLCLLSAILAAPLDLMLGGVDVPEQLFDDNPYHLPKHPLFKNEFGIVPDNITELERDEQMLLLYYRMLQKDKKDAFLNDLSETVEALQRAELDESDIVLREPQPEDLFSDKD